MGVILGTNLIDSSQDSDYWNSPVDEALTSVFMSHGISFCVNIHACSEDKVQLIRKTYKVN